MISSSSSSLKKQATSLGLSFRNKFAVVSYTDDIVSGLAIDSAPSGTYVWTYVLPLYDEITFLHMTLGQRVAFCEDGGSCIAQALDVYKGDIGNIRNARDLISYIEKGDLNHPFAKWAKFLSLVRLGDFQSCADLLSDLIEDPLVSDQIREKANLISSAEKSGGWENVAPILDVWHSRSCQLIDRLIPA